MNKIHIIGVGPGTRDYLLPVALREIEGADCLIGAQRNLDLFEELKIEKIRLEGHFSDVFPYLKENKEKKKIAVLVSGDPGLYSFLRQLSSVLDKEEYIVIPGISALQLAFTKIGDSWQDAKIISLHGRGLDHLAEKIENSEKVFLFTDQGFSPEKIAEYLLDNGLENRRAVVLENLSYPDERIVDTDLLKLKEMKGFGLCVMILKKIDLKYQPAVNTLENIRPGILYGLGIGPGDPKLLTLRAKEILEAADIIFVPKGKKTASSLAYSIIKKVVANTENCEELVFPMTSDNNLLVSHWKDAAERIANEISKDKCVVFVTLGDPFIYSTYIYLVKTLKEHFPEIEVETVPGISAFNAGASRLGLPLVEKNEKLAVVPVTKDLEGLRETLEKYDTVVLMKVGSKLEKIMILLNEMKLIDHAVLISHVGLPDEKIIRDLSSIEDKSSAYLSLMIVKKNAPAWTSL